MKAVGFTCGIGSMLVGAKQAGFDIIGNIEWRKYYHYRDSEGRNTFEENFPGAFLKKSIKDLTTAEYDALMGVDLAMGHPECGNYSVLSGTAQFNRSFEEMNRDPGDIPIFVEMVKTFKPRFFVQDNLPKSLMGYTMNEWADALPEYDLFPEWISNWGYGNIQKFRKRFFMIGALKSEGFIFNPKENDHSMTLRKLLKDLPEENHDPHTLEGNTAKGRGNFGIMDRHLNWNEYKEWMLTHKDGATIDYLAKDGTWKKHVGHRKGFKDGYVPVITGGCPIANPFTGLPFSLRERCRIQGLPDNFELYGTKLNEDGTWDHYKNMALIKQTGKCMPVEFCRYVSEEIRDHMEGIGRQPGRRILNPNPLITEAKQIYCKNYRYSRQETTCLHCWVSGCGIKKEE